MANAVKRRALLKHAGLCLICGLMVLVGTTRAGAQLSTSDWMTAGGYGNLFLLDNETLSDEAQANATLFTDLWKLATGQEVTRGPEIEAGFINVALGTARLNEDVVLAEDMAALGQDGYFLSTYSPSPRYVPLGAIKQLVIAGNNPVATRMGVYGFFRRALDCEFPAPGVAEMRRAGFRFEKLRALVKPGFAFREVGYPDSGTSEERDFRIANGLRPVALGQQLGRDSGYSLVPPEKYFDTHPEFYAEVSGQRTALKELWRDAPTAQQHATEFGDLCPSAPGLPEAIVVAIKEAVAAGDDAGDPALKDRMIRAGWLASQRVWAVTPMRGAKACECAACTATTEAEGSAVGPWLTLANAVGVGLEAAFPGEGYRVLLHADDAYQTPPGSLQAASNVIVALFTTGCDFATPISAAANPENKRFGEALAAWSRSALHVWVIDCLSSLRAEATPFPVLRVLQDNLRFYAQHNVEGVYLQSRGARETNDDFSALKYYLAARLLYDPDADVDYLTERFLAIYYGDAADAVAAYLHSMKPISGLLPTNSAQTPLLEARAAAQGRLGEIKGDLPADIAARVRVLLP